MNRYTLHCTEEQTKKALELGAPIERGHEGSRYFNIGVPTFFDENDEICRIKNSVVFIPTAEQMIGWLEEQDIYINILWDDSLYAASVFHTDKGKIGVNKIFTSRKEATLAAIDAALEHLIRGGKK